MAAPIKNREKIVIGSIAALLTILVLHIMVFSKNARTYSDTIKNRNDLADQIKQLKDIDQDQIKNLQEETDEYKSVFENTLQNLNVNIPIWYMSLTEEDVKKQQDAFVEKVRNLVKFCNTTTDIRLTFREEKGWDIPKSLPKAVEKGSVNLLDEIDSIKTINAIYKTLVDPRSKREHLAEGIERMGKIGINVNNILSEKYGSYIYMIKLIAHVDLIREKYPDRDVEELIEIFTNFTNNIRRELQMGDVPFDIFQSTKQVDFLADLLEIAKKNRLDEIIEVKLSPSKVIYDLGEPEEGGTPTPTPTPVSAASDDYYGYGYYYEGGGAAATPPPLEMLAQSVPIVLKFKSSNQNAHKFLYEITHNATSFSVDMLTFISLKGGAVQVETLIGTLSMVNGMMGLEQSFNLGEKK